MLIKKDYCDYNKDKYFTDDKNYIIYGSNNTTKEFK